MADYKPPSGLPEERSHELKSPVADYDTGHITIDRDVDNSLQAEGCERDEEEVEAEAEGESFRPTTDQTHGLMWFPTLDAASGEGTQAESTSSTLRDTNVLIRSGASHDGLSSSSSEESLTAFDRGGQQGSYVLRKGERRRAKRDTQSVNGERCPVSNVAVTPINTMDRSQQQFLEDFGSSSDDEDSVNAFEREAHRSLVLRRGERRQAKRDTKSVNGERCLVSSVAVTPINTMDRSQQQSLEDFGSSSDDEDSVNAFEREAHRSLVLRRAKPRLVTPPIETVFVNPEAATIELSGGDLEAANPIHLHKDVRDRIYRSLDALNLDDDSASETNVCDPKECFPCLEATTEPPVPPELDRMKRLGFKMFPVFFFPALPKVLQDIWVAIELFVTYFEFIFACVTFGDGGVVNTLVVILTLVNLLLASTDGFLYFVEGGSCVSLFKWGRKRLRERRGSTVESKEKLEKTDNGPDGEEQPKKDHFRERFRKLFSTGSEVVRAGLTELLLYPLTILDFFELIESQTYKVNNGFDRINFSLLNIGLFYLVLTVYLIRMFMSLSTVISISRLPKTTNSGYQNLLKKFALHIISQICVHMLILVMVVTKVDSEVCETIDLNNGSGNGSGANTTSDISINVSPFLYVTIFTGDVIPFLGVAMFFVVNYPALKQFMMGFCIDMMSTILSEDFAGTAFKGEGIKHVKTKTSQVKSKVDLGSTRIQFSVYNDVFSFKKKLAYRLTNPLVMVLSSAYFALVTVFLTCHALGRSDPCDSNSTVSFITPNDHAGVFITFIIGLIAITIANYQVVFMSLIWLVALVGLALLAAAAPFVILVLAPLVAIIVSVKSCL